MRPEASNKRLLAGYSAGSLLFILLALTLSSGSSSHYALAFNLDTQSPIIHQGEPNTYFGYSVAQHRDRNANYLLVGAPKGQTDQANTKQAGAVYRCSPSSGKTFDSNKTCQQILFDPNGSSMIQLGQEQRQQDDKSYQWFGASLHSAKENGSIVACAPRYVYYSSNLRRRDPVGTCWISRGSFTGFLEYSPCRLNDLWGHHHLGSCQAGFSSAISKDGSRLFMGAPGARVWQGQVFAHNLHTDLQNSTSAQNPHSEDDSYLGYAITLGKFSAGSGQHEDVAISIPRGADLAGKVMITDREMRTLKNITGEQMGAYFGYSLATIDLNGDGLDDLAIGAPFYYDQITSHKETGHYERGRVYLAFQSSRHEFNIQTRLDGSKNRARFGISLANCADLNRDGIQDLAVGAPYDGPNGHGAVYIFMGRKSWPSNSDSIEPDQVIYAESLGSEGNLLKTFGFSLSGGLDLDANQYPDLLIGDYQADRVILLRTRPVVNVTSTVSFSPEHFNLDEKKCTNNNVSVSCINVQYCIKYTGFQVDNRLSFVTDIKLDTENKGVPRLFFLGSDSKHEDSIQTTLAKDASSPNCKSFKVYIARQIRDKLTPLKVDVEHHLVEGPDSYDFSMGMTKLKPILNKVSSNKISKLSTIQKNCGQDNVCVPNLKLTMNANLDQFTIGSNEEIILNVTVKNYGEDAFESMFYLTMPMTVNYVTVDKPRTEDYPLCYPPKPDQTGVNVIGCDLGNPQGPNDVVKFAVITKPATQGPFTTSDFTFVANVNSTNPERDREDNQVAIGIPIKVQTNLVLSGSSNPQKVMHNFTNTPEKLTTAKLTEAGLGPEIYHTYQLQNRGPSTINDIALTILWPTKTSDGDYLLYLVDEPQSNSDKVKCKPSADNVINPLNLKYMKGNLISPSTTATSLDTRYKRQVDPGKQVASSSTTNTLTTTVDNSILQQLNLCGQTKCDRFECNVVDLRHNDIVSIKIRSRLYEETLNKPSWREFDISSKLVAQVKSLPYNVSSHTMLPYVYKVETQIHTIGFTGRDLPSWWLILLAILIGIILFILVVCLFKYLGFFTRKRPPKGAEREPLTPTIWNDYQYTPGDTAL